MKISQKSSRLTAEHLLAFLSSDRFFKIILGWFLLETVWAAFSLVYPMAFDENYHFGIIKIYASQWSPVISHQPTGTGNLGELPYLPSFLFHYLMSFPYWFFHLFTSNQTVLIIVLRLINIALFAGGIVLFKRLLKALGFSKLITNLSLLFLTFIPSVMLLAAEINYDNLMFLATPIFLLLTTTIVTSLQKRHVISFKDIAWFAIVGSLTSLIKYSFLPIFAAAVILIVVLWLKRPERRDIWHSIWQTFGTLSKRVKSFLLILLVVCVGFFIYRYGTNLILFHDVDPDCDHVLAATDCAQYGPWNRNHTYLLTMQQNGTTVHPNIIYFETNWVGGMIQRLYFAIDHTYANSGPLWIQVIVVAFIALFGVIFSVIYWRAIHKRRPLLWVALLMIGAYILSLQYVNWTDYAKLGQLTAINGRYLIPFLPIIFATVAAGFSEYMNHRAILRSSQAKAIFIITVIFFSLFGAGMFSYIIYASPSWYWPHSPLINLNSWLQTIIRPLVLGGYHTIRIVE